MPYARDEGGEARAEAVADISGPGEDYALQPPSTSRQRNAHVFFGKMILNF